MAGLMIRKNTICPGTCKYPLHQGFTLLELIIVILILGVMASGMAVMLMNTFTAMEAQIRHVELAADADRILNRMVREIRISDLDSIKITNDNQSIEFSTFFSMENDDNNINTFDQKFFSLPDHVCSGPAGEKNPNCRDDLGPPGNTGKSDDIVKYRCDKSKNLHRMSAGTNDDNWRLLAESVSDCEFMRKSSLIFLEFKLERDGDKVPFRTQVQVLNR